MSKNDQEAYRPRNPGKAPQNAYYDDDFDDEEEKKPPKPAKKPGKKKSHAGLWLLVLVLIFGAIGYGVWYFREPLTDCVNRLTGNAATNAPVVTPAPTIPMTGSAFADLLSSVEDSQGGETSAGLYVEDLSVTEGLDSSWLNILLLGADARNTNEPTRTDTMMILSINRKTGNVKLASIMRDTAVSFEGYDNVRLNTAYFHGGERLTMKTINEFFGDAVSGVREALEAFQSANVDGVIFDVRSNTGGQLDICLDICDMVLPEGIIVYTEDRYGYREYYYSKADRFDFPMVILVNGQTASASEIFASAAQDYEIAAVVGTQTFGKGIVQTQYPFLSDNAAMQLTTSSYYSPLGRSIHGEGVTPDVKVELSENYDASIYAPDLDNDNQLKAAYDLLMTQIHAQ